MKKLLLYACTAVMTISANAQNVDAEISEVQAEMSTVAAKVGITANQAKLLPPMRTKANGVYYTLPTGMIYRGGAFGTVEEPQCWKTYTSMVMYVAPFHKYHFENMCTDRAVAKWSLINSSGTVTSIDEKYPEYVDENHNLNYNFGNPSTTGSKVIPTISVGEGENEIQWKWGSYKDDAEETPIEKTSYIYVRPEIISLNFTPTQMYSHYTGFTNNDEATKGLYPILYGHGTGATWTLKDDDNVYVETNSVQFFPAPATPLYFEAIRSDVLSYSETPIAAGKKLYAKVYKAQLIEGKTDIGNCFNYEKVGEPIAILTADQNSLVATKTNSKGFFQSYIDFKNIQTDAFGIEYVEPIVVDGIFCVEITGYDEEGVDIGFSMYNATSNTQFPRTICDCRVEGAATKDAVMSIGVSRGIHLEFVGMLDAAKVFTEGSYYTDDTKTTTEMRYNLNKFQIADDGSGLLSNGTLSSARVYTALDWKDEDGVENYYITEENSEELPAWILGYEVDNSSWASSFYSKIKFTAEPLPEGVKYREAKLYVQSDKGALSEDPIILYQGDATLGINGVALDNKKESQIYNLMGQKVSRAQNGVFIKDGKKYIAK